MSSDAAIWRGTVGSVAKSARIGHDEPMTQATVVGVDIGGSKTHAVRTDREGLVVAEVTAGSANFESVSRLDALRELDRIFDGIGRDGIEVVCVGSAGINTPEQEDDLAAVISARAPRAKVLVAHDTRLILATAELDQGIGVISGTGSVAWGRNAAGRTARSGGWGYLLGDEGSGYWVTREAVRHVLRRCDSGLEPDRLAVALAAAADAPQPYDLLGRFYAEPSRRYWAQRSEVVFKLAAAGDPVCMAIIAETARALVTTIVAVADQIAQPGPVALGGGLVVHQTALQDLVRVRLAEHGIVDVRVLVREPVFGAVYLARRYLRRHEAGLDVEPGDAVHP
jgi:glucosamine kinase